MSPSISSSSTSVFNVTGGSDHLHAATPTTSTPRRDKAIARARARTSYRGYTDTALNGSGAGGARDVTDGFYSA